MTIPGTWSFNPETGKVFGSASKPGIWWDNKSECRRALNPVGGDLGRNLGEVSFGSYGPVHLAAPHYVNAPIPGNGHSSCGPNLLVNGDVFAVKTTAGNYAKFEVVSYGYELKVKWVTYR